MKIFSVLTMLLVTFMCIPPADAGMKIGGYKMGHLGIGQGIIYSQSELPICVSRDINNESEDLTDLYSGKSASRNYFKMVEVGNAGIDKAIKRGKLKRISAVSVRVRKVNIPVIYLPLFFKRTQTVVYGNIDEDL